MAHQTDGLKYRGRSKATSEVAVVPEHSDGVNGKINSNREAKGHTNGGATERSTHRKNIYFKLFLFGLVLFLVALTSLTGLVDLILFVLSDKPCRESMENVGDKSPEYKILRKKFERLLPLDPKRTLAFVQSLRARTYEPVPSVPYDVNNCPFEPPPNYPYAWPVLDVLTNWPTNETALSRPHIHQGLCVFSHEKDLEKALNYREKELPFVVKDDLSVLRTVERWNSEGYMEQLLGETKFTTEYSPTNHFLYWRKPSKERKWIKASEKTIQKPDGWTPPTERLQMTYGEWLKHASTNATGPDDEHWYFRLVGCGNDKKCYESSAEFLFDELPFFQPRDKSFYVVEPDEQHGIYCRFGMTGVIAENHFDSSRNMIAVLGGERRYILSHPNQCQSLCLFPLNHPSARHSAVDWTDPDLQEYPQFKDARVNEVVLQAGDVLYLPTNWFHYIVSLELNFQCNTRSGVAGYDEPIRECGF